MWDSFLVGVVFPLLALVVTALAGMVLEYLRRKLKLNVSEEERKTILGNIQTWVLAAENKAAQAMQEGEPEATGAEKFASVLSQASQKFPKFPVDQLANMIHATVLTIPGVGPTDLMPRPCGPPEPQLPLTGKGAP